MPEGERSMDVSEEGLERMNSRHELVFRICCLLTAAWLGTWVIALILTMVIADRLQTLPPGTSTKSGVSTTSGRLL